MVVSTQAGRACWRGFSTQTVEKISCPFWETHSEPVPPAVDESQFGFQTAALSVEQKSLASAPVGSIGFLFSLIGQLCTVLVFTISDTVITVFADTFTDVSEVRAAN